jgi:ectoine hydroxylase-related dioxygenase (phytanoyl-CoA dioxygenase family)
MLDTFDSRYFIDYYTKGYLDTGITLDDALVEEMRAHYKGLPEGRNDYPQYFEKNEHQAYLESRTIGLLFNLLPGLADRMLNKLYSGAYNKSAHAEQVFIERVCNHLLRNGFAKLFKVRYLIATYDIYLGSDHKHRSFTNIHSDIQNFHHFYETEQDVTIYIPLIDLNAQNGGRLAILPEARSKLKVPGNVLLKLMEEFFGAIPACVDETGYIDPDRISDADLKKFTSSPGYRDLMESYRICTQLACDVYGDDFLTEDLPKGRAVIFTNKNFHAAETWRNQVANREVYMLRLLPMYDCKIRLKRYLHGKPFNNHLIDLHTGEVRRFDTQIDVASIPAADKLPLRPVAAA